MFSAKFGTKIKIIEEITPKSLLRKFMANVYLNFRAKDQPINVLFNFGAKNSEEWWWPPVECLISIRTLEYVVAENKAQDMFTRPFVLQVNIHVSEEQNITKEKEFNKADHDLKGRPYL